MEIFDLTSDDPFYENAVELLKSFGLLTSDIKGRDVRLWALASNSTVAGVIGLERAGPIGLLRSLAVSNDYRVHGLAKQLCNHVVTQADDLDGVYLLTETATGFFSKIGFTQIKRDDAPKPLRDTPQFSSLCPASATVMVRH